MVDRTNFNVVPEDEEQKFTVKFSESVRVVEKDFNKLENRPKYNNVAMTGDTNIPEVPSKLSQLTNDSDYQTGSEVDAAILVETTAREDADTTINGRIDTVVTDLGDEETARKAADKTLQDNIDAEATTRYNDDIALGNRIDGEVTARQNADIGLQGQIDAITSSSDVVDIVGTYADLQTYPTTGLGNNDVIKVLQDETHNDAMSYYRWSTSTSTWSYIGSEGPYYTKSESDTLLLAKQNKLTAGSNITISGDTISATDTTYTAGTGLTLTGTQFSADTSVLQEKLTAGDGIAITGTTIKANIDPADFFTASETVNGEGSEITLNGTIDAPLDDVQLKGDTEQQTYSGKNILPNGITTQTFHGVTITRNDDGSLVLNGQVETGQANYSIDVGQITVKKDISYTISGVVGFSYNTLQLFAISSIAFPAGNRMQCNNGPETVTANGDETVTVKLYIYSGQTYDNVVIRPMVEVGSSATNYEKFVGGIPSPNPDYPQEVQTVTGEQTVTVTGKNLCYETQLQNSSNIRFYFDKPLSNTVTLSSVINTSTSTNSIYLLVDGADQGLAGRITGRANEKQIATITFSDAQMQAIAQGTECSLLLYKNNAGFTLPIDSQIEQGLASSAYEPYQGQKTYEVNLGKNLFDKNNTQWLAGYFDNGDVITNGATERNIVIYIPCQSSAAYSSPSQTVTGLANRWFSTTNSTPAYGVSTSGTLAGNLGALNFTTPSDAKYIVIRYQSNVDINISDIFSDIIGTLQVEKGSTPTPYAPYFAPIELCKIGTYQDKIYRSGEDWYLHKEVDKAVLDSTLSWVKSTGITAVNRYRTLAIPARAFNMDTVYCTSSHNIGINAKNSDAGQLGVSARYANDGGLFFATPIGLADTVSDFNTWVDTNKPEVYYALGTPTDTQITDATLISELEALRDALSYGGQTNFEVTASNLPAILNVTAYKKSLNGVLGAIKRLSA